MHGCLNVYRYGEPVEEGRGLSKGVSCIEKEVWPTLSNIVLPAPLDFSLVLVFNGKHFLTNIEPSGFDIYNALDVLQLTLKTECN